MHDGGAPAWRDVVEKGHARLIDQMAAAIASERKTAVEAAVAAEREIAKAELTKARETAAAELIAVREDAEKRLASEREKFARELASERESAKNQLESQRERANKQLEAERDSARKQLESERENAKKLESERENTRKQLEIERENAKNHLQKEMESAEAQKNADRDRAARELNAARAELAETAPRSKAAGRQSMAEALNQSLRRIRQATSSDAVLQLIAELSSAYAHKVVVLVFENNQARVTASRGLAASNGSAPEAFDLTLENAPALASAIDTRDPVTVLARETEVSTALVRLLAAGQTDKVYLFPLITRHQVVAMLVASGEVFPAAPELLAEAAGMQLESVTSVAKELQPVEDLVTIQHAAAPGPPSSDRRSWDDLSADDQKLHLQAQRVARVRVARMRLDREDAWRRGVVESDVYGSLRREIESARTEFLQTFLSKSSTMVDYLHLEILRTLAHEDNRLLGREYPGPMV
jgi:hypothetical protein